MSSKVTRLSNLGFFFEGYIKNKIWRVPQLQHPINIQQHPINIQQLSGTTVRACRSMPTVLIQNAFDGMVWYLMANMLLDIPFPMNNVIIDQLALTLVDICLDNTLQILCKSMLCFARIQKIYYLKLAKNLACEILYVQLQNSISRLVLNRFNILDVNI